MKGILTLEYITIYFGFSLMVLGILKIFNLVDLTSAYFFGLAISGLCFTLIDYAALNNKKEIKKKPKLVFLYMAAVFFVLVFPNLTLVKNFDNAFMTNTGEALSLGALGLVIYINGLKNRQEFESFLKDQISQLQGFKEEHSDLHKQHLIFREQQKQLMIQLASLEAALDTKLKKDKLNDKDNSHEIKE